MIDVWSFKVVSSNLRSFVILEGSIFQNSEKKLIKSLLSIKKIQKAIYLNFSFQNYAMNLEEIYEKILLIRTIENKIDDLFKKGLIQGTAHFCIGQEYIPVIISQYLKKEDSITSNHRGHGHAISKDLDIKKFLAELMGNNLGFNSGKGGSQHILSKENNFFSNGITGGMVPIANGLAFANKFKNNSNITVAFLGDGAINEGYVLESLNLAVVLKLPILFVCENNLYAMSTSTKKSHSSEIIKKVKGFGMEAEVIEDNDFKKLDELSKKFIKKVREEKIPCFIEIRTYRHCGHSKNDQNLYRDKAEEEYWFNKDVLKIIEKELINKEEIQKKIEKKVEEIINSIKW